MSKVTKKELQYQINGLAAEASTRHNSIMRIHRALASIGVDIFSDDFDLTEPEPQLKQLDQSIFDGLDEKWRFAAVDADGAAFAFVSEPARHGTFWGNSNQSQFTRRSGKGAYDATDWQNSLIERESVELTGSDLARAMLARGDKYVLCGVSDGDDSDATNHEDDDFLAEAVTDFDDTDGLFGTTSMRWLYAVPINNQGEPLTAAEAGL